MNARLSILPAVFLAAACVGGSAGGEDCPAIAIPTATGTIFSADGTAISPDLVELVQATPEPGEEPDRNECRLLGVGEYQCFSGGGESSILRIELEGKV